MNRHRARALASALVLVANDFAGSTWLVWQAERDAMFAEKPAGIVQPATFSALKTSRTVILQEDEHDAATNARLKKAPTYYD